MFTNSHSAPASPSPTSRPGPPARAPRKRVGKAATIAALTRSTADGAADVEAITEVVRALSTVSSPQEAVRIALDTVRDRFGWAYGSYWTLDPTGEAGRGALRFAQESGDAGAEFRQVTLAASFAEGVGLSGRAWRARDLVFVADLAQVPDCVRAPAAQRAGVKSGVCFPIIEHGRVVATMDFFTTEEIAPSPGRLAALRAVGVLVSAALERAHERLRQEKAAQDVEAVSTVIRELTTARDERTALRTALDTSTLLENTRLRAQGGHATPGPARAGGSRRAAGTAHTGGSAPPRPRSLNVGCPRATGSRSGS